MMESRAMGKNRNSGTTLVELLVVIAILGIMVGAAFTGYSLLKNANVKKAVSTVSTMMSECRGDAMSQDAYEWNMVITKEKVVINKVIATVSEGKTTYTTTEVNSKSLSDSIDLMFSNSDGISLEFGEDDADIDSVKIVFKELTGAVKSVSYSYSGAYVNTDLNGYCEISAEKGSKTSLVRLYYITGKNVTE